MHATDWSPRSRPLPRSEAKPTIVKSSNDGWESRDNGQVSPRTARQIRPASSRQDTVPQSILDNPFDDRETEKNGAKRNRDESNRTTAEEADTTTSRFPNRSQSSARPIGQTRDTAFRFVDGRISPPAERLEFPASQMIVLESKTSTAPQVITLLPARAEGTDAGDATAENTDAKDAKKIELIDQTPAWEEQPTVRIAASPSLAEDEKSIVVQTISRESEASDEPIHLTPRQTTQTTPLVENDALAGDSGRQPLSLGSERESRPQSELSILTPPSERGEAPESPKPDAKKQVSEDTSDREPQSTPGEDQQTEATPPQEPVSSPRPAETEKPAELVVPTGTEKAAEPPAKPQRPAPPPFDSLELDPEKPITPPVAAPRLTPDAPSPAAPSSAAPPSAGPSITAPPITAATDGYERDCRISREYLLNRTLADINLDIAVAGVPGEDFPVSCDIETHQIPINGYRLGQQEPLNFAWTASGLCHKPLYFRELQAERYGHTIGPISQPFLSAAHFFCNAAVLPYKMGMRPPQECVYALGHNWPGDPAPRYLPAVPISLRGGIMQAGAVLGAVYVLP